MYRLIMAILAVSMPAAHAQSAPAPRDVAARVSVSGAWARAMAPGQVAGAAYLSLTASRDDTLTEISTGNGMAMLHRTTRAGAVTSMEDIDTLALPAGRSVALAPGGIHIMLMDLPHPLRAGDTVSLTFKFAHASPVALRLPVLPIGADGALPAAPPASGAAP